MKDYICPDYTRILVIKPLIVEIEQEKVSWLTRLWRTILLWDGWIDILLILLLTLESGLIVCLLYWFMYI